MLRVLQTLCCLILLASSVTQACYLTRTQENVVKITGHLRDGSDLTTQGTGLLFQHQSELYVVTSEHILIPDKAKSVHVVTNPQGQEREAQILLMSWSRGLAILKVSGGLDGFVASENVPALFELKAFCDRDPHIIPSDMPKVDLGLKVGIRASGFPAGEMERHDLSVKSSIVPLPAGAVLADQRVLAVKDLPAEFGMSGGVGFEDKPASLRRGYGDDKDGAFIGILTHAISGSKTESFLIPGQDVVTWMVHGRDDDDFERSFEDFQTQAFAKTPAEVVHERSRNLRIEKRGGIFVISQVGSPQGSSSGLVTPAALAVLPTEGSVHSWQVTGLTGAPAGFVLNANLSLQQFVYALRQARSIQVK